MEIWLDSTCLPLVEKAKQLGILHGVTTNPTLLANANESPQKVLKDLLTFQDGPITAQVVAETVEEMVDQGMLLHSLSKRIIVKIPVSVEGLEAIHLMSRHGIQTMATVLFTPEQALLAAKAGADYIAPYIGRIESNGHDPWKTLQAILNMYKNFVIKTKILAASIRRTEQIVLCAELGIHAVTLKDDLFQSFIETDPATKMGIDQFAKDWDKVKEPLIFGSPRRG